MSDRKRNLTDSEARWEAVCFIDAAARDFLSSGGCDRPEWTEADAIAIEQHVLARLDGLIRRPRKKVQDGGPGRSTADAS